MSSDLLPCRICGSQPQSQEYAGFSASYYCTNPSCKNAVTESFAESARVDWHVLAEHWNKKNETTS